MYRKFAYSLLVWFHQYFFDVSSSLLLVAERTCYEKEMESEKRTHTFQNTVAHDVVFC